MISLDQEAHGFFSLAATSAAVFLPSIPRLHQVPCTKCHPLQRGEGGKELFVEKRRMTRPVETLEIVVSARPVRAGIDPFHELIDAHPEDNVRSL
jgi:hypothetical protein